MKKSNCNFSAVLTKNEQIPSDIIFVIQGCLFFCVQLQQGQEALSIFLFISSQQSSSVSDHTFPDSEGNNLLRSVSTVCISLPGTIGFLWIFFQLLT